MGRPSLKTDEVVEELLERMSKGEPLACICRDDHMPHMSTWRLWCRNDENLNIAHAHARDDGYDMIAADTLAIADDSSGDTKIVGKEGSEAVVCDSEFVQRSKLRVDTRLKLLAKWDPRRYGDKLDVTSGGEKIDWGSRALQARDRAGE